MMAKQPQKNKNDKKAPAMLYFFPKAKLFEFLLSFTQGKSKNTEVYLPLKRTDNVTRFERITPTNAKESEKHFSLEQNSLFPIKEHFFAKHEIIFDFDAKKIVPQKPKVTPKVFFGLRRCDLAAITHQDKAFFEGGHIDPYYATRREQTLVFGYHCPTAPSQYCFCGSLNLEVRFDLMFFETGIEKKTQDKNGFFLVEAGSEKGAALIKKFPSWFKQTGIATAGINIKIPNSDRLHTLNLKPLYDHPDWKKGVDMCLSCGACTTLCPTCYCFEFKDKVKMANPKEGSRVREWSSCQVPEFTKVAGGHVFRQKREERFKHRIYHQLDYFKEKMGVDLCVGCGRCIEGCPTRIDFVDIINKMKK